MLKNLFLTSLLTLCAACTPTPRVVIPTIDPFLLTPCDGPQAEGLKAGDVAQLIVDYDVALDCANGKITAIGETVEQQKAALNE